MMMVSILKMRTKIKMQGRGRDRRKERGDDDDDVRMYTLGVSVVLYNHGTLHSDTLWSSSYHPLCTVTTTTTISTTTVIVHGAVLIFTGLRIRAALRRQNVKIRYYQNTPETSMNLDGQQPTTKRSTTIGSSRTLKIIAFTSVAFFLFWSPYVFITLAQMFFRSFKPPAAVEFVAMWLANTNSAVNVFIYSSTNTQFRRQCVRLASRLCSCSRLSCFSSDPFT